MGCAHMACSRLLRECMRVFSFLCQVRSNALLEVGGSPTWTLTEDYALGMQLKKYGWHCRYVQEYLAIGEAPDQIRNVYQQRSRWCKVPLKSHKIPVIPLLLSITEAKLVKQLFVILMVASRATANKEWKGNCAGQDAVQGTGLAGGPPLLQHAA